MIFKLMLVGHLLGDFYFQTDKLARDKKKSIKKLILHSFIHFLIDFLIMLLFLDSKDWIKFIVWMLLLSIGHGIVDLIKVRIEMTGWKNGKYEHYYFLADQMIHIVMLYGFACIIDIEMASGFILPGIGKVTEWLVPITAVLICGKPASIFVSLIFKTIPNTIAYSETEYPESIKIGSWIGILEREIILLLGLMNQFSAIGFVLAAKSLARYKQLENKAFAEKYLVGTLLSACISIICIAMCRIIN